MAPDARTAVSATAIAGETMSTRWTKTTNTAPVECRGPTGAEKQLTSGSLSVLAYRPSRDGAMLIVERAPTPLEDEIAIAASCG